MNFAYLAVFLIACAAPAYGVFRLYEWARGPKALPSRPETSDDRLRRAIANRQTSIYRSAAIVSVVILFVWAPIFALPRGTECRPMGQEMISMPILLFVAPLVFVRAVIQLIVTWPRKTGLIAVVVALAPVAVFVLSQWVVRGPLGIIYED